MMEKPTIAKVLTLEEHLVRVSKVGTPKETLAQANLV
jgi:hypothetical protein